MNATDEHAALLRAILEQPDCDTVRLAYADWLDEHGDEYAREHADFIRRAVYHAAYVCHSTVENYSYTTTSDLWWYEMMGRWPGRLPEEWRWERGFVYYLQTNAVDWSSHGDAVRAAHPVRRVRLTAMNGLVIDNSLLIQRAGSVNEWSAIICAGHPGEGTERWPGVTFELPDPGAV